jgi:hypothetical protein
MLCPAIVLAIAFLFCKHAYGQSEAADAKELFLVEKCNRCHSISSLNIENTGQKKISDLSDVGSRFSTEFIIKYLNREEAIEGKKHLKNLKSEGADIETVAKWLSTLKKK